MIKAENGKIAISGKGVDILCEYSLLTKHIRIALREQGIPDDEVDGTLKRAFEVGFMSDEELKKEA